MTGIKTLAVPYLPVPHNLLKMKSDAANPYGAVFFLLPHREFVQQEITL